MSELIQKHDNRATIRWKLLTGASALALTAYVSSGSIAGAEDASRPQVWIEFGAQLNSLSDNQEPFAPGFLSMRPSIFDQPQSLEKPPTFGMDEFGKISFQPEDSNWIFSASIRYGRALKSRHKHQQTYPSPLVFHRYPTALPTSGIYPYTARVGTQNPRAARFADTQVRNSEQHTILDFQAGKDVGLGLFGKNTTSNVSVGVRIAQFRQKSNIALKSDPDWHFKAKYVVPYYPSQLLFKTYVQPYHSNSAGLTADRSFRGVGPSLSWSASAPFAGNSQDGELTFDWGINAAALFGRQKTRTQHHTTVRYNTGGLGPPFGFFNPHHNPYGTPVTVTHNAPAASIRSRNVTVPNVGGSVGLSYRYADAKLSIGYRYDTFLSAMDTGIDAAKKSNVTFNGPYASISVGLGD
jgi:iron complex outermembrane receptor protein